MKNATMVALMIGIIVPVFIACATNGAASEAGSVTGPTGSASGSTGGSAGGGAPFNDVTGRDWVLTEIRSTRNTIAIDRRWLEANNVGGFFTINFQEGNVSGVGAPNRYRGPYTTGSGHALRLGNLASTLMASFIELEDLKEHEYYAFLGNVTRWNLRDGKLELDSTNPDGSNAVLVFTLQ